MEKGLVWFPLLGLFIGLAWAGWNDYQKVESYRTWATQFQRAKYDIYAVLGQEGSSLTWGKPSRQGPVNLQTFSLKDVQDIRLLVDDKPVQADEVVQSGRSIVLEFTFINAAPIKIPFTEVYLAREWWEYLLNELRHWQIEAQES